MKLTVDMKSLAVGIIVGIFVVLTLAAGRGLEGTYECAFSPMVVNGRCLFAVLNTRTGSAQITLTQIDPFDTKSINYLDTSDRNKK
ncbi:MAG: hypothetical protein ACYSUX_01600 [Planctomycetota bacterium]|jgi:hypothetical protein